MVIGMYSYLSGRKGNYDSKKVNLFFYKNRFKLSQFEELEFDWDREYPICREITEIHSALIIGGFHTIISPTLEIAITSLCKQRFDKSIKPNLTPKESKTLEELATELSSSLSLS